jgi:hypothetical protein
MSVRGALPTHADPSPTKDLFRDQGYFAQPRPRDMLFDLTVDPLEQHNLADDPAHQAIRTKLDEELERWRCATDDPLLQGEIPAPPGARLTALDTYGR